MKILVLSNLYPPHHSGTYDFRCQIVCDDLRARGHDVFVLTSTLGLNAPHKGLDVDRELVLNGHFDLPRVTSFMELKDLEFTNNGALHEAIKTFEPQIVFVWSLLGLSKSLVFALEKLDIPIVYDVADNWVVEELRTDPWLDFWNCEKLSFKEGALRKSLEVSGQRDSWDEKAPTRFDKSIKRMPYLYTGGRPAPPTEAGSIRAFFFKRIYFCSLRMKEDAIRAGYAVEHADVIQPLIQTDLYQGEVKGAESPANSLVMFRHLVDGCGALTALKALAKVRETNPDARMDIYGEGNSQYIAKLKSFAVQNGMPVEIHPISDPMREMPTLYPKYDIFVHPTEMDETLVPAPLEAMACGLPVIGTLRGGIGSFLINDDNALTFLSGDETDLAEKIQALQGYPDYRQRIASCGQERVRNSHGLAVVMTWIESYLQDTIAYWDQL